MRKKYKILIIGSGFVGTATAIRLLHHAKEPIEIVLLERVKEQRCGGVAFGKCCAGWEHTLNIQTGRLSVFREHPNDLVKWANYEADRSGWPEEWRQKNFNRSSAMARRIYQQYLADRLRQAEIHAVRGVILKEVHGEAIDLVENRKTVIVTYNQNYPSETPKLKQIRADRAIIATGHLESVLPSFVKKVENNPHFVRDQFSKQGWDVIKNLGKNETAFILGTGLRGFDAVLTLLANGHNGPIILCSRHGLTHAIYRDDHLHEIIEVRRPPFLDEKHLTPEKIIEKGKEEFNYLVNKLKKERSDIAETVLPERILKAWEPYVVEIVERLPSNEVKRLYDTFKSVITTLRVGTIPEIGHPIIEKMMPQDGRQPQVRLVKAHIQEMIPSNDGHHINVFMRETGTEKMLSISAGAVISCVGRETDYTKVKSPLWRNLIDIHKIAVPHKKTGRGIEVGEHGELISAEGKESQKVFAVGIMREGDETQRRGRLGSFVHSLGPIKNNAFETALTVLNRLNAKKMGKSKGMPHLNLSARSENASNLIAGEAMRRNKKQRMNIDELKVLEKVRRAIDSALNGRLVNYKTRTLATLRPKQRKAFEEKMILFEKKLKKTLEKTALDPRIVADVVKEVSHQAERVALQKLIDIKEVAYKFSH